jgi:hypothetical protein
VWSREAPSYSNFGNLGDVGHDLLRAGLVDADTAFAVYIVHSILSDHGQPGEPSYTVHQITCRTPRCKSEFYTVECRTTNCTRVGVSRFATLLAPEAGGKLSMGLPSHCSPLQRASGAADTAEVELVAEIEFTA